jgi:hypothetical protein
LDRWGRSLVDLITTIQELTALQVGRVGLGGCPPRPPTDPDVQNSSIRFLIS